MPKGLGSGVWKRTHERQENKKGKVLGEQEIRRESPGEHKSNEVIGEQYRAERMQ